VWMKGMMPRVFFRAQQHLWVLLLIALTPAAPATYNGTLCFNNCSGHGFCRSNGAQISTCLCDDGWGSINDVSLYKAPDCAHRTCPSGISWASIATGNVTAHMVAECSDQGVCDRSTGKCACSTGFNGAACERKPCLNGCSGHGQCLSMKVLARYTSSLPLGLGPNLYQQRPGLGPSDTSQVWDDTKIFGCLCDSSWPVGLGANQRQEPEWFGPDCSLKHCPSSDNPSTPDIDETNCSNITAKGSTYGGLAGNLCQVDCANRGICDHSDGTCKCFRGYSGLDCSFPKYIIGAEQVVVADSTGGAFVGPSQSDAVSSSNPYYNWRR